MRIPLLLPAVLWVLAPVAALRAECPEDALREAAAAPPGGLEVRLPDETNCLEPLELTIFPDPGRFRFNADDRHDATDADADGEGFAARALFESPSGKTVRVPAFFAQPDGTWRLLVRFAPEEPGGWSVHVEAADARGCPSVR